MNKNYECSSPAESDDDHDYVEIDKLGTGSTYKQCADDDDDDDYVNTKDLDNRPTSKQCTDVSAHMQLKVIQRAPASSNGKLKILLMILILLLLGSLAALCALMILYLSNVASFHTLHEQYVSATGIMKVQEHEAADLKSRLDQVQMSFERVSEQLNTLKVQMRNCEMKYQQMEELLSEKQAICEEGWRSLGLKCYFFSNDKLNWMESRDSCVKKGADLVIITSQKEQDFLSGEAKETSWIGLNDRETEGKWMWVNKQTLEETGVTFWYQNVKGKSEPDNWTKEDPMGENCACLLHDSVEANKWFDASCNYKKKYICQK